MKILKLAGIILTTSVLLSSCMKFEIDTLALKDTHPDFYAYTEAGAETKVNTNGTNVLWEAGDKIAIFNGSTLLSEYVLSAGAGTNVGAFTYQSTNNGTPTTLARNYAIYPYSYSTTIDEDGVIYYSLPTTQHYVAGSFGKGEFPMVAVTSSTTDDALLFKNLCGAIKIQMTGTASISSITINANDNAALAGYVKVYSVYGEIPTMLLGARNQKVILDCGAGVQLNETKPTEFWFVVPPIQFKEGFTITVVDTDGWGMTKTTNTPVYVGRTEIQPMVSFAYVKQFQNTNITIPDANFKAYIVRQFDKNGDGEISIIEANAVDDIRCDNANISSLEGIQYFTSLTYLGCCKNKLTTLDVSNNKALTALYCYENNITTLDVSNNTVLKTLHCRDNQLTSVDVSSNTALTYIDFQINKLTSLDVSKNTSLTNLYCYDNSLTTLDVSKNTALTNLSCGYNQLTTLDVSKNTALTNLQCAGNRLTTLDVSKNTALTNLQCADNRLTTLDVSKNITLAELYCSWNNSLTTVRVLLNSIKISKDTSTSIIWIDAEGNANTITIPTDDPEIIIPDANFKSFLLERCDFDNNGKITINEANKVTNINCIFSSISSLEGIQYFTALTYLNCSHNQLTTLDLSKNTALTYLNCSQNQLTTLDISNNTALTYLDCLINRLTTLDMSNNTALKYLSCYYNQLTTLDVSKSTALTYFNCEHNQLTTLDVSKNVALSTLDCNMNQLSILNVRNNTALTTLDCTNNPRLIELLFKTGQIVANLSRSGFTVIKYQ